MKTFKYVVGMCLFFCGSISLFAQPIVAEDQNPRYKEAMEKYIKTFDSINKSQSGTIQQTYYAYDWYQEKMKRKQQRFEARLERRSNRSKRAIYNYQDPYYYSNPYLYSPYGGYGYGGYGYDNNWLPLLLGGLAYGSLLYGILR